jgi:hypothetical protein
MVSKERLEQPNQKPTESSKKYLKYLARPDVQFSVNSLGAVTEYILAVKNLLKGQYELAISQGIIAGFLTGNAKRSLHELKQSEANRKR